MQPDNTAPALTLSDLSRHLARVNEILSGRISVGGPWNPLDPTDVTYAGAGTHNGTIDNLEGSWVEQDFANVDTTTLLTHNLNTPVVQIAGVNQPNVRWFILGFSHNGTGVGAGSSPIGVNYDTRDALQITTNVFPLRIYATARTVVGNPIKATILFVPAVR